jgi:hypothetical protein
MLFEKFFTCGLTRSPAWTSTNEMSRQIPRKKKGLIFVVRADFRIIRFIISGETCLLVVEVLS